MNDLEKRQNDYPSTSTLSKRGISAVACTAAGLFLIIMQVLARSPVLAFIVGGLACVMGIVSLMSKDATDKKAGALIGGAGILVLLSKTKLPFIGPISGTLIVIGAVGLLAMGIWNAIKFLKGLRKRS